MDATLKDVLAEGDTGRALQQQQDEEINGVGNGECPCLAAEDRCKTFANNILAILDDFSYTYIWQFALLAVFQ